MPYILFEKEWLGYIGREYCFPPSTLHSRTTHKWNVHYAWVCPLGSPKTHVRNGPKGIFICTYCGVFRPEEAWFQDFHLSWQGPDHHLSPFLF